VLAYPTTGPLGVYVASSFFWSTIFLKRKLPRAKMPRMGQTLSGDLLRGAEMCVGGGLGPVGSPGWRRREESLREVLKVRLVRVRMRDAVRKVVVVVDMMGVEGGMTSGLLFVAAAAGLS
jgi:hypothetical protein